MTLYTKTTFFPLRVVWFVASEAREQKRGKVSFRHVSTGLTDRRTGFPWTLLSSSDSQLNRLTHNAFKPLCLSLRPSLHLCLSLVLVYITFPTLLSSSLLFPVPFFYVTLSLFVTNSRCTHSKGVPLLLRGGAMKLQCPLVAHCRHSRVSHAAIYSMFLIVFLPSFW